MLSSVCLPFQVRGSARAVGLWYHGWLGRSCVFHSNFWHKMLWIWLFVLGAMLVCASVSSQWEICELVAVHARQKHLLRRYSSPMNLLCCAVGLPYLERLPNCTRCQNFVAPSWEVESSTTSTRGLLWVATSPISSLNVLFLRFLALLEHTPAYGPSCRDWSWPNA